MKSVLKFIKLALWLFPSVVCCQTIEDLYWWGTNNNWDGITHWSRYIIRTPGYMGPNALPVPAVGNATVDSAISLETAMECHKGRRELACNPYINLKIPLAAGRVALDLIYRPVEYYKTERSLGLERFTRFRACEGVVPGDVYIGTVIHLLDQKKHKLDANADIYMKTASGKGLANARHIDAPAYYFDANFGRTFNLSSTLVKKISIYTMAGLYVWQADFSNNRQDDAFLYGISTRFDFKPLFATLTWSGYTGYINRGDKPMVLQCTWGKNFKHGTLSGFYRYGLRDMIQNSVHMGYIYSFRKK